MDTQRSPFLRALETSDTETLNKCKTHSTSSNPLIDLFFTINTFRTKPVTEIQAIFYRAFNYSLVDTLRILFWSRDIRGGQGERRVFREILKIIAQNNKVINLKPILGYIPFFGRWDDVLVLLGTPLEEDALNLIKVALHENDALCAKWMPREKSSRSTEATTIRNFLGLTPKQYRKKLAELTQVVESQMCDQKWDNITYSHVPSRATLMYRKAFEKHSPERWAEYLTLVSEGKEKVNAGTLYPYDIIVPIWDTLSQDNSYWGGAPIKSLTPSEIQLLDEQWKALPNYMENNSERIIPVIDTSGSMYMDSNSPMPIQVSVSLGLYIAEHNRGPFKDHFITFSQEPVLQRVEGKSIHARLSSVKNASWGYSTNLERVFQLILESATKSQIQETEMPTTVLVLSDMEFNQTENSSTMWETISQLYDKEGYKLPKVVFWNLSTKTSNFPVKFDDIGVAMVSGFSPTILKQILTSGDITPERIMYDVIHSLRYSCIQLPAQKEKVRKDQKEKRGTRGEAQPLLFFKT